MTTLSGRTRGEQPPPPDTDSAESRDGLLGRLGRWSLAHFRVVSVAWLVVMVSLGVFAPQVTSKLSGAGWQADGSASVKVRELAREHFNGDASSALQVVVTSQRPVADGAVQQVIGEVTRVLKADRRISGVVAPRPGATISRDGRTAVVLGGAKAGTEDMVRAADDLKDPLRRLSTKDVSVRLTGSSAVLSDFNAVNFDAMIKAGVISWPVISVIMVIALGSFVAAGLPLLMTVAALVAAAGSLALIPMVLPLSIWALDFAMMFALALGIGYALFLVIRFRTALARLGDRSRAIAETMDTAGKSVLLWGVTVLVSLLAVTLAPVPAIRGTAVATAVAVAFVLSAMLTLLPAVLGTLGHRINAAALPWARTGEQPSARSSERTWRQPLRFGALGLAVLIALSVPLLGLRTAVPSIAVVPQTDSSRQGLETIQKAFGPGASATLAIIAPKNQATAVMVPLVRLSKTGRIAAVLPTQPAADGSGLVLIRAVPSVNSSDPSLPGTVKLLRAQLPNQALVGGSAVESIDVRTALGDTAPLAIALALMLGFVLLFALRAPLFAALGRLKTAGKSTTPVTPDPADRIILEQEPALPTVARTGGWPLPDKDVQPSSSEVPAGNSAGRWGGIGIQAAGPIAGAVAVVALLGAGTYVFAADGKGCADAGITLEVTAAPEIEPAVSRAARRFDDQRHQVGDKCVKAVVHSADPAQTTTLLGQGMAVGVTNWPDVWIPDSSLWTALIPNSGQGTATVVSTGTSIAQSPIVAGLPRTLANTLRGVGVTAERLSWQEMLRAAGGLTAGMGAPAGTGQVIPQNLLHLQVPDPVRNASGLASLMVADALPAKATDRRVVFTSMVRTLREHTVSDVPAAFAALRADQKGRYPVTIVPEQAVFSHNQRNTADPVLAIYPREGTLSLDYPFTVVTGNAEKVKAARLLQAALRDEATRSDLRTLGFRTGGAAPASSGPQTEAKLRSLPVPAPADVRRIVQEWYKLSRGMRNLSLIDVSASMGEQAGPGLTRLQVATQAAQIVVGLLPDDTRLGVWSSSTPFQGARGEQVNLTIGRLGDRVGQATRRQQLLSGLGRMHVDPAVTDTGLYDSVLSAFRLMTRTYQPEQVNSVIVYTAGQSDGSRISQQDLVATLRREYDSVRPVQIIMVGIGDGVDRTALDQIAKASHGSAYLVRSPQQIQQIVLSALSRRVCAPNC